MRDKTEEMVENLENILYEFKDNVLNEYVIKVILEMFEKKISERSTTAK